MSLSASSDTTEANRHAAEIARRLADLVRAPARLIPYERGAEPRAAAIWRGQWTAAEKAAATYYESLGYEVVRLSHETSVSVGKPHEAGVPGAAQLAQAMRRILPDAEFRSWTTTTRKAEKALTLNCLVPRDYPVSCYPPDFLCARGDDWLFVEVKGPGDALHFRQANWLLHRRDPAWPFEVCMPLKGLLEARFVADEIGPGPAFAAAYADKLEEHHDFLVGISMRELTGKDLVAAEDRNAASIVRDRWRLWAGLAAKGHDPSSLSTLRSGRPMTVLDPHWPPELTSADRERMAHRAAKQAENMKRIAAHNRQSAQASRRK